MTWISFQGILRSINKFNRTESGEGQTERERLAEIEADKQAGLI